MKSRWIPLLLWTLTLGAPAPAFSRAADLPAMPTAGLRRLDADAPSSGDAAGTAAGTAAGDQDETAPTEQRKPRRHHSSGNDDVNVIGSTHIEAGKTVAGDAVAVMGSVTVDGHVEGDAVCVMGNNTINGTVDGDAVCVMGDLTLGPKAHVGQDVTCVMGTLHRDPGAVIEGEVHQVGFGVHPPLSGMGARNWWDHGLSRGSVMAFGPHLIWLWFLNLGILAMYAIVALAAPHQVRRCGDLLRHRPGLVILSGVLGVIAFPILIVLLCVTVIGIPVALLTLPAAMLLTLFGKGSVYALIGRAVTGDRIHPAGATLVGGVLCLVFLLMPVVGVPVFVLLSFLGWGCGVAAILTAKDGPKGSVGASPSQAPAAPPAAAADYGAGLASAPAPMPPPVAMPADGFGAGGISGPEMTAPPRPVPPVFAVPPPAAVPPLMQDADVITAPRAGFWIRTAGLLIDGILVGFLTSALGGVVRAISPGSHPSHDSGFEAFMLILAAYGAVMWKIKEATIGGLVCNLRVARLDGRPVDWPTAIVRALGCFVSLFAAGLGFIWVAFDVQRQSWHDKIAGTTVVHPTRRRSLV